LPRDLLSELDDEPVGIGDVHRPVSPRTVGRPTEHSHALSREAIGASVHVLDNQHDFGRRPG
jgi:hypothetical protein